MTSRCGNLVLCLIGIAAIALGACASVGETADGGPGPGTGGAAGSTAAGTGGTVVSGTGGMGGQGGMPMTGPRPLIISAREAVRRLIVVLWNQTTDAALMAEADAGAFKNSEDIRKLALRMLDDPRARVGVGAFYRWWLNLEAVAELTKNDNLFTSALGEEMAKETELFGVDVTLDASGTLNTLYTAPFSFLTERLARIYGVAGVTGTMHRKTALNPAQRAGILTQPSILALSAPSRRSSPSARGIFVDEKMLCRESPIAPVGLPALPEPLPAKTTTRQAVVAATSSPSCSACHALFDPPGFALEGFDAIGRARTTDNGAPVDTKATVTLGGSPQSVSGAPELAQRLAQAPETALCFAQQWLTFALGRGLATEADNMSLLAVQERFM
ncbi:MAG TPA: DUF1588 domain-containing protein, partial [Polyangia bacterium]|nr:DUF1588 domain-containing protein [Polyangia bacterium]